ncbi:MAG: heavy metal-binding domain-containing protein [Bacteroidales bacterium]|nr:heavy metal-binding domain-containing protein [Bacteroidales bacterium]
MITARKISLRYAFSVDELETFLRGSSFKVREQGGELVVDDKDVNSVVNEFKKHRAEQIARKESEAAALAAQRAAEIAEVDAKLSEILVTSGFTFDGYRIVKYSGYISGDDAISVERGYQGFLIRPADAAEELMEGLRTIRRNALRELKDAAYNLGCNAVIGVDFDYITLEPEAHTLYTDENRLLPYVFCVTANGNAVIIEKDNSK